MGRNLLFCSFLCLFLSLFTSCYAQTERVVVGAERLDAYLPDLQNKRVALLSNHTGIVFDSVHILDCLLNHDVNVTAVFSPEHGFRGTAGAGAHVENSIDEKTGIPILSLYTGRTPRPSDEAMQQFDVLIIDIQDVGLRFYTYYITMVRLMDACADFNKQVIVLDRPNPNGFYVDGPILDMRFRSGVGWLPIPVVHGMTLGELALMVNGERWLPDAKQCKLKVIPCLNYTHQTLYRLPVPPSPNLKNMLSIYLYPSICYFEATPVSLGRGTDIPFLCYGHPDYDTTRCSLTTKYSFIEFTPRSMQSARKPPQMDNLCYGVDLSQMTEEEAIKHRLDLTFLIDAYRNICSKGELQAYETEDYEGKQSTSAPVEPQQSVQFFTAFLEKLIGVDYVRPMIEQGKSAKEISACWQEDVDNFKVQRRPYLLYQE